MMKKSYFVLKLSILVLLFSCGSTKNIGTEEEKALLDKLIDTKTFEIESSWAKPLASGAFLQLMNTGILPPGSNASNINLIGNANYFRMKNDSVAIDLPFYGERRRGGGYNQNAGISYEGSYKDFDLERNDDKHYYKIKLAVSKGTEQLQFTIWLYDNLRTIIALNSSDRSFIDYDGSVAKLEKY